MKVFLSAVETNEEHSRAIYASRAPSVLTSYYYAKSLGGQRRVWWQRAMAQAKIKLIDSGAYSIRTAAADRGLDLDYDKFLTDYIAWIRRAREVGFADVWVEVDIGLAIGSPWVQAQRQKFLATGLGFGLIQVWHPLEHSWKDWEALIAEAQGPGRSNWVAIEGNSYARDPIDYAKFLAYAYKKKCKVHGFRLTSIEDNLKRYPFYSVDSTTWMTGVTFGTSLGVGMDGWLSLRKSAAPVWGSGKVPRHADGRTRLDWLVRSAQHWVDLEQHVTQFWVKKGIHWQ